MMVSIMVSACCVFALLCSIRILIMCVHKWLFHFIGAYMVVKIIIEMVRMKLTGSDEGVGNIIKDLEEPAESIELRINVVSEPRYAKEKAIEAIETFREYVEVLACTSQLLLEIN